MVLADDLRGVAARARAIPGTLGLRPHRVYLATGYWSGEYPGHGLESAVEVELTEGGQPPQVKWLNEEAMALGGHPVGTVEVGNLTPAHAGGGIPFSELIGTALTSQAALYVRIVGPRHPDGARYRIREARHKSALSYALVCTPEQ